ncbi:MAG TPA: universal stress protein [Acidimicrobiales bacterium]
MAPLPTTVVVPLDGSGYAERAIRPAKVLASRLGVGVGAVRVVSGDPDEARDYILEITEKHGLQWAHVDVSRDVAAAIHAVVSAKDGAVCMATHGHGRAAAVLGSTAEELLAQASEPIMVVGRGVDQQRIRRIERLVVALDGTPDSEVVCGSAIGWARELGLRVSLVTVAGEPMTSLREGGQPRRSFGPADPYVYIADAVERYETSGVELDGDVIVDPISPASGLSTLLREVPHAVLAMATHGRRGLARLIHGSVAATIVDASPVPVVMFSLAHGAD